MNKRIFNIFSKKPVVIKKTNNMRLEQYQHLYELEREWKYKLDDVILIPIAIITGLCSILYLIIENKIFENNLLDYLFLFFYLVDIILIFISTIFYILSYIKPDFKQYGYQYSHIISCDSIEKYRKTLIEEDGKTPLIANEEIEGFFIESLVECTDDNRKNNRERARYVSKARLFLYIAIVFTFIISTFFTITKMKFANNLITPKNHQKKKELMKG